MIDEYPLIPDQAFLYFPEPDRITEIRNGINHRIIFGGGLPFDQNQNDRIRQLKNILNKLTNKPYLKNFSDDFLLRFLQATSFNNNECVQALQNYYKWQQSMIPYQKSDQFVKHLRRGILYFCGRDYHFRPIIVVDIKKILDVKIKQQQLLRVLGFFFQYIIDHCLIQGQVQTWNTIIDLGYCGVFSLGSTLVDIIKYMSSNFRARSSHTFLIKCPSAIKFIWGMVKGVLNQDQLRKITMTDKQTLKNEDFIKINYNQIQQKYGGTRSNITQFWPIQIVPYTFVVKDKQVKLITQDQYNKMYNCGQLKNRKIKKLFIQKYNNNNNSNNNKTSNILMNSSNNNILLNSSRQTTIPYSTFRQQDIQIDNGNRNSCLIKQQSLFLYPEQVKPQIPKLLEETFTYFQLLNN